MTNQLEEMYSMQTLVQRAQAFADVTRLRILTLLLEGEAWVLPATTRVEYEGPRASPPVGGPATGGRRLVEPCSQLAWTPAALPLHLTSLWVEGTLALAGQAMRLWLPPPLAPADPIHS